MRITVLSKVLILIVIIGVGIGGYRFYQQHSKPASGVASEGGNHPSAPVTGDQGLLGRPLRVGVVTWPGYAGGIMANNGFAANKQCIYWNDHKLLVEFLLMEDVDARAKAFARGGSDGIEIVWATIDFCANGVLI